MYVVDSYFIIDIRFFCLIKNQPKNYSCKIKQDYFPFLCSRFFFPSLFSVLVFIPYFHFSHHIADLFPPPLSRWFVCSLSQYSRPLLIFLYFLPRFTLPPLPPAPPLSSTLFAPCDVCFFFSHIISSILTISYLPPNVPTCVTPSRSFPSVLWKLSPLWGCLAEDHSPSAPAVPLKVT